MEKYWDGELYYYVKHEGEYISLFNSGQTLLLDTCASISIEMKLNFRIYTDDCIINMLRCKLLFNCTLYCL